MFNSHNFLHYFSRKNNFLENLSQKVNYKNMDIYLYTTWLYKGICNVRCIQESVKITLTTAQGSIFKTKLLNLIIFFLAKDHLKQIKQLGSNFIRQSQSLCQMLLLGAISDPNWFLSVQNYVFILQTMQKNLNFYQK